MLASTPCCFHGLITEGADRVGGQIRRDQECPFGGVINLGSLEEGALKRGLEYGYTDA